MQSFVLGALIHAGFKPRKKHLELVALLKDLNELSHGSKATNGHDQRLDNIVASAVLDEGGDDFWGALGIVLGDVNFDSFGLSAMEQVFSELLHETVTIADVDEGLHNEANVGHFELLQKVLGLLGRIVVTFTSDTLDFFEVVGGDAAPGSSSNVLEVDIRVLRKIDDGAKEEKHSIGRLGVIKDLDKGLHTEFLNVLGGDPHHELKVGADVCVQENLQAQNTPISREVAKKGNEEFGVDRVSLDNAALDVFDFSVMFESAPEQTSFLAKTSNLGPIVLSEYGILNDGISTLKTCRVAQVHFKNFGLKSGKLWLIRLEGLESKRGALLDQIAGEEQLANSLRVAQRLCPIVVEQ